MYDLFSAVLECTAKVKQNCKKVQPYNEWMNLIPRLTNFLSKKSELLLVGIFSRGWQYYYLFDKFVITFFFYPFFWVHLFWLKWCSFKQNLIVYSQSSHLPCEEFLLLKCFCV